MKKNKLISSLIVGLGFPLTQFTIILYTPALTTMQHIFGTSLQQMLLTVSFIMVGYTAGNLFWGTLSDYIGRRQTLLIGLLCFLATSLIVPTARSFLFFSICLAVYGFVAATFTSVGNAILKDIHGQKHVARVIAYVGIAMATTPVIAPLIGTQLLDAFNWQAIYYFMGAYTFIMLLGMLFAVENTPKPMSHTPSLREGLKSHLSNRSFLGYLISLALLFGGILSTLQILPVIYTHYLNIPSTHFGYISLGFLWTYPLGSTLASQLVKKVEIPHVMILGLSISILAATVLVALSLLTIKNTALLSVFFSVLFLGFGLSISMAKAGSMTSVHNHIGSAASLMKFIQSLGAMIITALNAHLHQAHAISHFTILLLATLAGSLLVLIGGLSYHPKGT